MSEFAGAAAEMGEALLINPYDEERTASTVERALALEEEERRHRMKTLHARIVHNDVFRWGDRFLASLQECVSARGRYSDTQPKRLRATEVHEAYRRASRRLLILDYDGTLVPFAKQPWQAAPPPVVLRLLTVLAANPRNCVALTSGRTAEDLDRWFKAIGIWLIAEHGAELKSPLQSSWEPLRSPTSSDWES